MFILYEDRPHKGAFHTILCELMSMQYQRLSNMYQVSVNEVTVSDQVGGLLIARDNATYYITNNISAKRRSVRRVGFATVLWITQ